MRRHRRAERGAGGGAARGSSLAVTAGGSDAVARASTVELRGGERGAARAHGHRVEVLGAGRVVPRTELSGETLAGAVRELLADTKLAARLADYRARIATTRAVERCADLLEAVARERVPVDVAAANRFTSHAIADRRRIASEGGGRAQWCG